MKNSILNGKSILAVNDDPDVLAVLEEEILEACPNCTFDKATTYKGATERLASYTYHLIILDIMGVRSFDLLERAAIRKIPVTMLTAHPFRLEALQRSFAPKAVAGLPKARLGEVVPLLENILARRYLPPWKRFARKLKTSCQSLSDSDREEMPNLKWPWIEGGLK